METGSGSLGLAGWAQWLLPGLAPRISIAIFVVVHRSAPGVSRKNTEKKRLETLKRLAEINVAANQRRSEASKEEKPEMCQTKGSPEHVKSKTKKKDEKD